MHIFTMFSETVKLTHRAISSALVINRRMPKCNSVLQTQKGNSTKFVRKFKIY